MGKIKENPRYAVVSFRTTDEQKERLLEAKGNSSLSEFVDILLTLYLQGSNHANSSTSAVST